MVLVHYLPSVELQKQATELYSVTMKVLLSMQKLLIMDLLLKVKLTNLLVIMQMYQSVLMQMR